MEGENYLDQSDQPPNFWSFFYLNYNAPHPEQALLPQQEGFISHPIVFSIICHRSGKSWVAGQFQGYLLWNRLKDLDEVGWQDNLR